MIYMPRTGLHRSTTNGFRRESLAEHVRRSHPRTRVTGSRAPHEAPSAYEQASNGDPLRWVVMPVDQRRASAHRPRLTSGVAVQLSR
jgi:hypothetical protein